MEKHPEEHSNVYIRRCFDCVKYKKYKMCCCATMVVSVLLLGNNRHAHTLMRHRFRSAHRIQCVWFVLVCCCHTPFQQTIKLSWIVSPSKIKMSPIDWFDSRTGPVACMFRTFPQFHICLIVRSHHSYYLQEKESGRFFVVLFLSFRPFDRTKNYRFGFQCVLHHFLTYFKYDHCVRAKNALQFGA